MIDPELPPKAKCPLLYVMATIAPTVVCLKVGYTSNLYGRVSVARTGSPFPVRVVAIALGTRSTEKALHARLGGADRIRGEWWRPTRAVISVLEDAFPGCASNLATILESEIL